MTTDPLDIALNHGKEARGIYVSFLAAVVIPTAQAIISGFVVGLFFGSAAWAFGAAEPIAWALMTGSMTAVLALLIAIVWWRHMVEGIEYALRLLARPLPQAEVETPAEPHEPAEIVWHENGGRTLKRDWLSASDAELTEFANRVLSGSSISISGMTDIFGSRAALQKFLNELLTKNYLRQRNPRAPSQGVEPTPQGMALFRHFANAGPALSEYDD
jgi:hypothetical protein